MLHISRNKRFLKSVFGTILRQTSSTESVQLLELLEMLLYMVFSCIDIISILSFITILIFIQAPGFDSSLWTFCLVMNDLIEYHCMYPHKAAIICLLDCQQVVWFE